MDFTKLAIADALKHPVYGVVSYQPAPPWTMEDRIRARTIKGKVVYVLASVCKAPTVKEIHDYWRGINDQQATPTNTGTSPRASC